MLFRSDVDLQAGVSGAPPALWTTAVRAVDLHGQGGVQYSADALLCPHAGSSMVHQGENKLSSKSVFHTSEAGAEDSEVFAAQ